MTSDIPLRCKCGSMTGVATKVDPARGNRLVCMCDDCQAYAHWLAQPPTALDTAGGTEVFQLTPAQVELTGGREHLRCVRLSEKGLMRWYAGCCRTPIANTLASPRAPFIGLLCAFMPDAGDAELGPILARIQGRYGHPPLPPNSHQRAPIRLILRSIRQLLRGFVAGAHTPSPMFDASGQPVVEPTVLSPDERERLRGLVAHPPHRG